MKCRLISAYALTAGLTENNPMVRPIERNPTDGRRRSADQTATDRTTTDQTATDQTATDRAIIFPPVPFGPPGHFFAVWTARSEVLSNTALLLFTYLVKTSSC